MGFDSNKKRSSFAFKRPDGVQGAPFRVHIKGAAERVMLLCNTQIQNDGSLKDITSESERSRLQDQITEMARDGLRTFCVGYADMNSMDEFDDADKIPGLTMLALVGIRDPLRPEVPDAVATCKGAGVVTRMVTGDNIDTAKNIATACKIFNEQEGDIAMEGYEFRKFFTEKQDDKGNTVFDYDKTAVLGWVNNLKVLARSVPRDKEILVRTLQDLDHVVAATGDGTNDAPALHRANVGIAMGITGTEIAKKAADVVIIDDRFNSIVEAVKWGRNIFHNIRKFLQFQLTVNVVALILTFLAACGGEMPLTALQLLWVNLIMDTLGALALATELPDRDKLLSQKPYGKEALLSPEMIRNILTQSGYQLIVLLHMLWGAADYCPPGTNTSDILTNTSDCYMLQPPTGSSGKGTLKTTMIFNTFVWMQIFNEFNAREIGSKLNIFSGLLSSKYFLGVFIAEAFCQFILVQYCGIAVSTAALNAEQWFTCIGWGAGALIIGLIMRFLPAPAFFNLNPKQEATDASFVRRTRRSSHSHTTLPNGGSSKQLEMTATRAKSAHNVEGDDGPSASV